VSALLLYSNDSSDIGAQWVIAKTNALGVTGPGLDHSELDRLFFYRENCVGQWIEITR